MTNLVKKAVTRLIVTPLINSQKVFNAYTVDQLEMQQDLEHANALFLMKRMTTIEGKLERLDGVMSDFMDVVESLSNEIQDANGRENVLASSELLSIDVAMDAEIDSIQNDLYDMGDDMQELRSELDSQSGYEPTPEELHEALEGMNLAISIR